MDGSEALLLTLSEASGQGDLTEIAALLAQAVELLARLEWWARWTIAAVLAGLAVYFICRPIFYFIRK